MKKILMRAHMSPFDNPDFMELFSKNLIGTNIGNLLYARSICRTIMTKDTQVDTIRMDAADFGEEEVDRFNEEYDCFVIPLANAFRPDFIRELNRLSNLIENLTIPCVVVGVGLQDTLTNKHIGGYPFDEDVKRFINCVLEKSAMLGLRGEITSQYLEYLGYTPEKDFTVIGCPSMYLYGGKLPDFQKNKLTQDSSICVNSNILDETQSHSFIARTLPLLRNYHYIPQILDEMNAMYWGKPLSESKYPNIPSYYPSTFASPIYTEGHGVGFLNASSWMEYLSHQDFSFGSRIHGNIAAIISGTPCYIIASDTRVQELARYHYIPYTTFSEISEETTIFDLYEQADYNPMFEHHLDNFHHFLDFLNVNEVQHIYQEGDYVEDSPFDKKIKEIDFRGPIRAFSDVSPEEQAQRLKSYDEYLDKQKSELRGNVRKLKTEQKEDQRKFQNEIQNLGGMIENQQKKIQDLKETKENQKERILKLKKTNTSQKKKIQSLEKTVNDQEKELNHKSIQIAVKVRRAIENTGIVRKLKN